MNPALIIVLECAETLKPRVRYMFDTLCMAAGIPVAYAEEPPSEGPWLLYGRPRSMRWSLVRCCAVKHSQDAWLAMAASAEMQVTTMRDGSRVVFAGGEVAAGATAMIDFDLPANGFYFLASIEEREHREREESRSLYTDSVYNRIGVPQNVVDQYLRRLTDALRQLCGSMGLGPWPRVEWPGRQRFAVVLSHDVDFLPRGPLDIVLQAGKSLLRHLLRERAPLDAYRAMRGFASAIVQRRDPYGCVPEIIAMEQARGVRSSFQVAVARRHSNDVNYDVGDRKTAKYLACISKSGFDLCLHGSYRSSERPEWYREEVAILERQLGCPRGSRQHFLSFNYDLLFGVQETTAIEFDMSMGFPDRVGPRAGFSFPYFPYCMSRERPYDLLQISLLVMDVTLRSYMGLDSARAWRVIESELSALADIGGCGSVVWHPIVFGGARDPGYAELYWRMVDEIGHMGGLATDGVQVNDFWRKRAAGYASFAGLRTGDARLRHVSENQQATVGRSMP